jgi:hypothetical protein
VLVAVLARDDRWALPGADRPTVTGGAFVFAFPFAVDRNHYVFFYAFADQNADGACAGT